MKTFININNKKQKSVKADTPLEAAEIFATRTAKQVYGKKGYASTLTLDTYFKGDDEKLYYNYKALLKVSRGDYEIGCNVNVYPRELLTNI